MPKFTEKSGMTFAKIGYIERLKFAGTEMNQHSGKILATITFQIPVPSNTNIYATPQTHATPQTYIDLARPQKVHVHVVGAR